MKHLLILIALIGTSVGCNNSRTASPPAAPLGSADGGTTATSEAKAQADLEKGILGAWEIATISEGGNVITPERSDPTSPFDKDKKNQFFQLKFDGRKLTTIKTDFVHFSTSTLGYTVNGRNIVTEDIESFKMDDYEVVSLTNGKLELKIIAAEDENAPEKIFNLVRIDRSALATKTALSVSFLQNILVSAQVKGQVSPIVIERTVVGVELNTDKLGPQDTIRCSISDEGNLQIQSDELDVHLNSQNPVEGAAKIDFEIKDVRLDLNGPLNNMGSSSPASISLQSEGRTIKDDFKSCDHRVTRRGAGIQIKSVCSREGGEIKISLDAVCLLTK